MLTGFLPTLGGLALAQSQGSGAGIGVVIGAVGLLLAGFGFWRARALARDVGAARKERDAAQEALKAAQARERELSKKGEERQDETRELKQEVAGLRKKNHAAQEELKAMRDQLKTQAEERDRLLATRPAFETPRPEPKPRPKAAPRAEGAAKPAEPAKADPAPKAEPARAEATAPAADPKPEVAAAPAAPDPAAVADLTARVTKLEVAERDLHTALAAEREALKGQKAEVVRLRKYAEQLRRIDMVSKGKVEVLEDKLASLGRQYYEAVSELAAVKGEVRPPTRSHEGTGPKGPRRPHDERRGRGRPEAAAQAEPEAHATPDSDSLAAQMEAADAEANVHHEEPAEAAPPGAPTPTEV